MSASGQYCIATVNAGAIYISSNYGVTWTSTTRSVTSQARCAISGSGQYMIACSGVGGGAAPIYLSNNYGSTWISVGPTLVWYSCAMSTSGQYMYAGTSSATAVYVSSNYGQTWTPVTVHSSATQSFSIVCSASGQYVCTTDTSQYIYYSSNYGLSWTRATSPVAPFGGMAMSASGQYVIAGGTTADNQALYYSINYGQNWTIVPSSPIANWFACAMSANGQYLLAAPITGSSFIRQSITRFPPQSITSQSTTTSTALSLLAPNITTTNNVGIVLGQSITANDYATIGFQYIGDGSTANYVGIGVTAPTTLCIAATGNVGIKTSTPVALLDTAGTIRSLDATYVPLSGGTGLEIFYSGGGNIVSGTRSSGSLTTAALAYQASTHSFFTGTAGGTNALFITSTGTVGMNTTTTGAYTLNVTGSIYATGDITALSDKRKKDNIIPLTQSLDLLTQLTGYSYTRSDLKDKENIGLIAQEVKEVFPQAVTYDDELELYSLNYGCLIAPVIQAIKELKQTVNKLQEKVDKQDAIIQIFLDHYGPPQ
jgi:hypothetical protein